MLWSPDSEVVGRVAPMGHRGLEVGRRPGRDGLCITDPEVSRVNSQLSWEPHGGLVVRDCGSRNGTRVNGKEVAEAHLSEGDVLRFGDSVTAVTRFDPHDVGWTSPRDGLLVGASGLLHEVYRRIDAAATEALPVLIVGETGTGKELVARQLHLRSGRQGPLVAVNCGAIPADLFEAELFGHRPGAFSGASRERPGLIASADRGTLFLDELGEMPLALQAKLLRVVETGEVRPLGADRPRPVDVRIVAATLRDIDALASESAFRADLLARLDGWRIAVPPLRERPQDLRPILASHWRRALGAASLAIEADAFEALAIYDWPRNVRELLNIARAATVEMRAAGRARMSLADLPDRIRSGAPTAGGRRRRLVRTDGGAPSRRELDRLLTAERGNVAAVAKALDRHRNQVYRWMQTHGLSPDEFR